ncbi:acyl-CoA synthetase-like protein, partial [Dinothrombium tinctorium]
SNKTAVISVHESIQKSFRDLDEEVDKLSHSLVNKLALKKGDVVALWSGNAYTWLLIQYACARIGLILCTLNPVYKAAELEYSLQKSGAKALFLPNSNSKQCIVNNFTKVLNDTKLNDSNLEQIVFIDGDDKPLIGNLKAHLLYDLVQEGTSGEILEEEVDPDDPAIIMFTSGTTGKPKGAVLSHNNLATNAGFTASRLSLKQQSTIACIPVPLFHIFGMVYGSVMMSKIGMTIVLTGYRYKVDAVVDAINKHNCSHIMMVPAMTVDILNYVERNGKELSSLKTVITGSAPTPVEVAKKFLNKVKSTEEFLIRYGSTETGGCMTMPLQGEGPSQTIDNVGKPLDYVEIKIVDPKSLKIQKLNEQGELWARGHNVMLGYWNDKEKTAEAITPSGWFRTGDTATMDENGRIKLVGRVKEMIIRGGENIYPKEIEELLHKHPSIYEAFVCGVPDERMGEEICAWVKLKDGCDNVKEDDIKKFCKDKISYFKVPRYVLFVDEFPRTPTGKAQKFLMTQQSCQMLGIEYKK